MPYPRKMLGEGEDVILDFHPHWTSLVRPIAWTVFWLVAFGAGLFALDRTDVRGVLPRLLLLAGVVVAWLLTGAIGFLRWRTTEYVLTTDRMIVRTGIVAKQGREIPLENINDIAFSQTVFERMVGSGDLLVESAGEFGQSRYSDIPKPHLVQNEIYRQIEEARARMMRGQAFTAGGGSGGGGVSPARQIEELARLRDQGLISDAEYESKRAELLKRM